MSTRPKSRQLASLEFRYNYVGFDRVSNETILMCGMVHFVELLCAWCLISTPGNLRTKLDASDGQFAFGIFLHEADRLVFVRIEHELLLTRNRQKSKRSRVKRRTPPRDRHSPDYRDKPERPSPSSYGRRRISRCDRADTSDTKIRRHRGPISKLLCVRTCRLYRVHTSAPPPGSQDMAAAGSTCAERAKCRRTLDIEGHLCAGRGSCSMPPCTA
jgi:hypothetical protein